MPIPAPVRSTATRIVVLVATTLTLGGTAIAPTRPATAAPTPPRAAPPADPEGGTPTLRAQLEAASRGYLDAEAALERSVRRQQDLATQLAAADQDLAARSARVAQLADSAYRTGRLGLMSALLAARSPAGFMDRAAALQTIAATEDRHLRDLRESRDQQSRTRVALDAEIREQRKQVELMERRKQQAERALTAAGRTSRATAVRGTGTAAARPAPRTPDGSWPAESCSVDDPTTSGCITPRALHAMTQARAAGFTRYVSCHRNGGSGEHPRGRACDFAAQKNGFGGVATGGDRTYGNNLAAYLVRNANRLGVLYVIWFRQIWLPSSGWQAYTSGNGTPASDHTNHVHLSVY